MKAIPILPGKPNSAHLAELPMPRLEDVSNGRSVLVKVLQVGLDGTDREINAAEYGAAPPGYDFLVLGHESFGVVEQVGPRVTELAPGDFVVARVRSTGSSIYDLIGTPDMTTDDEYQEHGINLTHGFLTEKYVDAPENLVRVPGGLREVGVLVEPLSVAERAYSRPTKFSAGYGFGNPRLPRCWARGRSDCWQPWCSGCRVWKWSRWRCRSRLI